jgi:ABC-type proline/glycine betaine transport system permease subunit
MRVVVVANEAVSGRELRESLLSHLGDRPDSVFVVAPALVESGLRYHVVGLLLFQSVGYHGMWSRFFARLSLIGTPVAVAVSLLLGLWM